MAASTGKSPKILVVDGDRILQRSLSLALGASGFEPLSLFHPWRTAEVAIEQQPDLILVDVAIGYDRGHLLEDLKRDPDTRRVTVFMYSRKDSHYDRLLAFELGADDYFGKPFQIDALVARIADHFERLGCPPSAQTSMRDPLETMPDLYEIDRQQLELLRAEEQKRGNGGGPRSNPGSPSEPRPVLIVEDDVHIRASLSHILEEEGIPTLTASNGQEALDLMRGRACPSVVLLDLMMPVMDGWEFRRRVETDSSVPQPKFVVMSALSPDETIGSAVWLRKPLGVQQLLSTVTALAGSGEARPAPIGPPMRGW